LLQHDSVYSWLRGCYWCAGIRRDVFDRAFANSLVVGAYHDRQNQLGVARVVTDEATFAWLCDVFVVEPHRGKGIARAMVKELLADPRLQTLRRWCLATRDAHQVYLPLGFGPVEAGRWMELKPPASTWRSGDP
jgi:GNAT superfamily N-acetyltransferase